MASRSFLLALLLLVPPIAALKTCQEVCTSHDECEGELACMSGKCNDDPWVGTQICSTSSCKPSGKLVAPYTPPEKCNTQHMSACCKSGQSYDKYTCSPPVTGSTKATLTVNGFGQGEDGGGASACPPYRFYSATDRVVALSTGWYNGGKRCGKTIVIKYNGKSSRAKVVDECDSRDGCDEEHAYQPPCKNNIVDASEAVWHDLGVNPNTGILGVTWSML